MHPPDARLSTSEGHFRHADFMALALREAQMCEASGDVPVGALIVLDGRVIAASGNTRERLHDPTGHAEMNVLRMAGQTLGRWRLNGCTMYVTLEPCPMCAAALVAARISLLVFGASDPKAGAAGSRFNLVENPHLNHRVEVLAGVREADCEAQLKNFFRAKGKNNTC
ncbi:MAG: tRNA adenosine(34) deaminase TadA [Candidatus Sericytochromatia bacterium]|nr:tRNA adenosine(34) deaminase TadA [Candidatus Sericytochromatia bacterium]